LAVGTQLAYKIYRYLMSADLRSIENKTMNDEKWIVSDKGSSRGVNRAYKEHAFWWLFSLPGQWNERRGDRRRLSDVDRDRCAGRVAWVGARKGSSSGM